MVSPTALNHLYFEPPFTSCGTGTLAHPWSDNVVLMEMITVKVQEQHPHNSWRWELLLA